VGLQYRKDIDGLRAIAVLLVVLFHVHPRTITGGFVGVDVFFVISGYLITGLIFSGLHDGSLGLVDFYMRRIRRIFPALALVLAFCIYAGWFVFFPSITGTLDGTSPLAPHSWPTSPCGKIQDTSTRRQN
jgi:peptidoglycan/LPS O-acetylase OafA/YrhL